MNTKRIYYPTLEELAAMFPLLDFSNAAGARAALNEFLEAIAAAGIERPADNRIEEIERTIPGPDGAPDVPIRIYMPKIRSEAGPAFVNFHGGGFVVGDLESEHARCLVMAAEGGAVAVGVDYRLAPEHPFPAGVEDCYTALQWVVENAAELKIDRTKITIGGGSAGGNLTTAVALMARDHNGPQVAFQMLFYPALDDRCETASMKNATDTYICTYQTIRGSWDQYLGQDRSNVSPYAAPARADDLSRLPPAYILTCEHDPLRDEAIIFAMRLMAAGVPVELHNYPGVVHAFDFLTPSDISTQAINEYVEAFKRAMAS